MKLGDSEELFDQDHLVLMNDNRHYIVEQEEHLVQHDIQHQDAHISIRTASEKVVFPHLKYFFAQNQYIKVLIVCFICYLFKDLEPGQQSSQDQKTGPGQGPNMDIRSSDAVSQLINGRVD